MSPVFLTASKPGYGPALGLDGLAAHRRRRLPGRSWRWAASAPENAALCRAAGARGIAVMGEVMRAADPRAMVERFVHALSVGAGVLARRRPRLAPSSNGRIGLICAPRGKEWSGMGNINASIDLRREGRIAIVTADNPPVNALKHEVRAGLAEALRQAARRRRRSRRW